jgi:hypothetical protein
MPFPPEFITWAERQQAELRMRLEALESGTIRLQKRRAGAAPEWTDETAQEAAMLRKWIADLQFVLDKDREGGQ